MLPQSSNTFYALIRFCISITALVVLALADLNSPDTVPNILYLVIGGMNGVDLYNLIQKSKE